MGIAKDRAFHTEEIRKIYEKTGNLMGKAEESTGSFAETVRQHACGVLESGSQSGTQGTADRITAARPKTKREPIMGLCCQFKADLQRISGKDQPRER